MLEIILIISFFLVSLSGVLFHYTHQWFKKGIIVHMFSAVNESTWEHMKLAFSPMFFISYIQAALIGNQYGNFWSSMLLTLISSVVLIPVLYYPIRKFIGKEVTFISISLYFVSIAIAFLFEYLMLVGKFRLLPETLSLIILLILPLVFLYLTFYPPKTFLFKDPIKKRYGDFSRHK